MAAALSIDALRHRFSSITSTAAPSPPSPEPTLELSSPPSVAAPSTNEVTGNRETSSGHALYSPKNDEVDWTIDRGEDVEQPELKETALDQGGQTKTSSKYRLQLLMHIFHNAEHIFPPIRDAFESHSTAFVPSFTPVPDPKSKPSPSLNPAVLPFSPRIYAAAVVSSTPPRLDALSAARPRPVELSTPSSQAQSGGINTEKITTLESSPSSAASNGLAMSFSFHGSSPTSAIVSGPPSPSLPRKSASVDDIKSDTRSLGTSESADKEGPCAQHEREIDTEAGSGGEGSDQSGNTGSVNNGGAVMSDSVTTHIPSTLRVDNHSPAPAGSRFPNLRPVPKTSSASLSAKIAEFIPAQIPPFRYSSISEPLPQPAPSRKPARPGAIPIRRPDQAASKPKDPNPLHAFFSSVPSQTGQAAQTTSSAVTRDQARRKSLDQAQAQTQKASAQAQKQAQPHSYAHVDPAVADFGGWFSFPNWGGGCWPHSDPSTAAGQMQWPLPGAFRFPPLYGLPPGFYAPPHVPPDSDGQLQEQTSQHLQRRLPTLFRPPPHWYTTQAHISTSDQLQNELDPSDFYAAPRILNGNGASSSPSYGEAVTSRAPASSDFPPLLVRTQAGPSTRVSPASSAPYANAMRSSTRSSLTWQEALSPETSAASQSAVTAASQGIQAVEGLITAVNEGEMKRKILIDDNKKKASQLETQGKEIVTLKKDLESVQKELADVKEKKGEMISSVGGWEKQGTQVDFALTSAVASRNTTLASSANATQAHRKEKQELETACGTAQARCRTLEARLAELEGLPAQLENAQLDRRRALSDKESEIARCRRFERELEGFRASNLERTQNIVKEHQEAMEDLERNKQHIETELANLKEFVRHQKKAHDDVMDNARQTEQALRLENSGIHQRASTEIQRLRRIVSERDDQLSALQQQFASKPSTHEGRDSLDYVVEELMSACEAFEFRMGELQAENEAMKRRLDGGL